MLMSELVMNSSNVAVKMLAGTAVFCHQDGCEKPAVYLFSAVTTKPFCAAHCSEHAWELASCLRIKLPPPRKIPQAQHSLEASA
jgi:hypothetical protein